MATTYTVAAKLLLDTTGAVAGAGTATSYVDKFKGALKNLAGQSTDTGRYVRGMFADFLKAGALAKGSYELIQRWTAGVEAAKAAAAKGVDFKMNVTWSGDTPGQAAGRIDEYKRLAKSAAREAGAPAEEVRRGMGIYANPSAGPGQMAALTRYGTLLGMTPGGGGSEAGMDLLDQVSDQFQVPVEKYKATANLMRRYAKMSEKSIPEFGGIMAKAGEEGAAKGLTPEGTALLVAQISQVKKGREGPTLTALLGSVEDPKQRSLMKASGFKGMFDKTGKLTDPSEWGPMFAKFDTKYKNEIERDAAYTKRFGPAGPVLALAMRANDPRKIMADAAQVPDIEAVAAERRKTYAGREFEGEETKGRIKKNLYGPAEKTLAGVQGWLNRNIYDRAEKISEGETAQNAMSYGVPAVAGAGMLAAGFFGGRGLYRGYKGVKGAGGVKGIWDAITGGDAAGTAAGVARGMGIEKATGGDVKPVFVTNWPSSLGSGGSFGAGSPKGALDAAEALFAKPGVAKGLFGTSMKGAVSGWSAIGLAAIPVAIGAAGAYNYGRIADQGHKARAYADAKNDQYDKADKAGAIAASVRTRAEAQGLSEDWVKKEIERKTAGFKDVQETQEGVFAQWWSGMKDILGMDKGGAQKQYEEARAAQEAQRQSATVLAEAAKDLKIAAANVSRGK